MIVSMQMFRCLFWDFSRGIKTFYFCIHRKHCIMDRKKKRTRLRINHHLKTRQSYYTVCSSIKIPSTLSTVSERMTEVCQYFQQLYKNMHREKLRVFSVGCITINGFIIELRQKEETWEHEQKVGGEIKRQKKGVGKL